MFSLDIGFPHSPLGVGSRDNPQLVAKGFDLLCQLVPTAETVAYLTNGVSYRQEPDHWNSRLLRPPSKRPRSRAAEASNEIASSHRCKRWGASFPQGLKEAGYVEGQNLAIEYRGGPPRIDRLRELATELVRRQVAAILTSNDGPAVAAKRETSTIPIVFFAIGSDPVTLGLVASINRPGGNVTGASMILRNGIGEPIPILVDQRFSGGLRPK